LPFASWLTGRSQKMVIVTAVMAALAIYKHKANIKRLLAGTETRINLKKNASTPSQTT
jgi:glycerol-3-phosphate acyltransferase PlsY